jgi:exodeoxyribonuclease III
MAFRKKAMHILSHNPDILVVPECEHPDKLIFPTDIPKPTDTLWFGKNRNKGLAIFSYSSYRFTVLDVYNESLQLIVPISVRNKKREFILLAIWANNPDDEDGPYVEQVWKALHYYEKLLSGKKVILAGDFNSNTIWDKPRRKGNHSHVVDFLEKKKISSVYHSYHKQLQGKEAHPTLYMYWHKDKPYHIDYCFTSSYFIKRIMSVEIGDYDAWSMYSDHVPVIISFNIN